MLTATGGTTNGVNDEQLLTSSGQSTPVVSCFHCQLPVPKGVNYQMEIDGKSEQMCCPGCMAAASMVLEADLGDFYRYREMCDIEQQGRSADADEKDLREFAAYAEPDFMAKYCRNVDEQGKVIEADIILSGIRCAACVWLLEQFIGKTAGVESVNVNLANHRAFIRFDNDKLSIVELFSAINQLGYKPYPYVPSVAESLFEQQKNKLLKALGVAAIGVMQVMMFTIALYAGALDDMSKGFERLMQYSALIITTPVVLYSARLFFVNAYRCIGNKRMAMDVPVSLAIGGAYIASILNTVWLEGEVYFESVSMFTFFLLLSRFIELKARHQQSLSSNELVSVLPSYALKVVEGVSRQCIDNVKTESVLLNELKIGDKLLIENGATIAADGEILFGASQIDESAFSGESLPLGKEQGDKVFAGSVNVENPFVLQVSEVPGQSAVSNMVRLAQRAAAEKPPLAQLADKVAGYFVSIVLLIALAAAFYWYFVDVNQVVATTLAVLVVSCPCALSLATPVALSVANKRLMRLGLMPTTGRLLNGLAAVDTVLFDKTGTLTTGQMTLQQVNCLADVGEEQLLSWAASLETGVKHPLAGAVIAKANELGLSLVPAEDIAVVQGSGLSGQIAGRRLAIGNVEYIEQYLTEPLGQALRVDPGSVYVLMVDCDNGKLLGFFSFSDDIRDDAKALVDQFIRMGKQVEMISGDAHDTCAFVARKLSIASYHGGMKPDDKIAFVERLIGEGRKVLMVGDGINDAPALQLAHVSVAMNGASEFVQAKADGVLLAGRLEVLGLAVSLAQRSYRITKENMGWALSYNFSTLPLAAMGLIAPWLAALGMSVSSLIVLLNSFRLDKVKLLKGENK